MRKMFNGDKYYDRKGNIISYLEWEEKCGNRDYKIIQQDEVDNYLLSTVWLGIDHSFFPDPPTIFETMVFDNSSESPMVDIYMERYETEAEAIENHKKLLEYYKIHKKWKVEDLNE